MIVVSDLDEPMIRSLSAVVRGGVKVSKRIGLNGDDGVEVNGPNNKVEDLCVYPLIMPCRIETKDIWKVTSAIACILS